MYMKFSIIKYVFKDWIWLKDKPKWWNNIFQKLQQGATPELRAFFPQQRPTGTLSPVPSEEASYSGGLWKINSTTWQSEK